MKDFGQKHILTKLINDVNYVQLVEYTQFTNKKLLKKI